jgi:hypothetical protein
LILPFFSGIVKSDFNSLMGCPVCCFQASINLSELRLLSLNPNAFCNYFCSSGLMVDTTKSLLSAFCKTPAKALI